MQQKKRRAKRQLKQRKKSAKRRVRGGIWCMVVIVEMRVGNGMQCMVAIIRAETMVKGVPATRIEGIKKKIPQLFSTDSQCATIFEIRVHDCFNR